MENIEDYIKKSKLAIRVQKIWSITNNIIGYSLIVAIIVLGVMNGYRSTSQFTVFCWAAGVYFFSKYVYYPLFMNRKFHSFSEYKNFMAFEHFTSFFGNGNVLYGRFGSNFDLQRSTSYSFLSIMYIPLIPTGRYHFLDNRKMIQIDSLSTKKDRDGTYQCWIYKKFDWAEVLYIYLKNWSFAVMVITVINTIMWDYVNPAIYG